MSLYYMISGAGNISLVLKGEQFYISTESPIYDRVLDAIKNEETEDQIEIIVKPELALNKYLFNKRIKIKDGVVYYKGEEMHNTLSEMIIKFINDKAPFEPLLRFMDKVMRNPSEDSRKELFDFLGHKNLPVCDDGDFLAYKAVRKDYTDKHTGQFKNSPGNEVKIKRSEVDANRNQGCSFGLHAGTLDYVNSFATSDDKKVVVKIDPSDVVSVPLDCNCQKLRTRKYYVISDFKNVLPGTYVDIDSL